MGDRALRTLEEAFVEYVEGKSHKQSQVAFAVVYAEVKPYVDKEVRRLWSRSNEDTEDITGDVMKVMIEKAPEILKTMKGPNFEPRLKGWLRGTTRNVVRTRRDKKSLTTVALIEGNNDQESSAYGRMLVSADKIADPKSNNVSEDTITDIALRDLLEAGKVLTADEAEVFVLHLIANTQEEIAERLGIPRRTVGHRLERARKKIAKVLELKR